MKNRLKLRLINPNSPLTTITLPDVIKRMTMGRKALFMPVNLAICAAVTPSDYQVEIIDECVHDTPHVPRNDVEVVGIGAMTTQAKRAYQLADEYRRLGVKVIMGGIHPSALPDEALEHCDAVCIGDAEGTWPHALNDLASDQPLKPKYNWRDYPSAPIATPRKDLLNPRDYLVFNPIQTTRGCPHDCTFCTTPAIFGRKFRQRSIEDIVTEMKEAQERGSNFFIFSDDNFAGNHRWALELCQALIPLKIKWASQCDILISNNEKLLAAMRASGCQGLILGLESPNPDTLTEARKRYIDAKSYLRRIKVIQKHRISLWGSFIFGFDNDNWQSCQAAVKFAHRANLVMSCYPILTPYPGTALYEEYQKQGRILTQDWDKYNGATVVFQPKQMSVDQLRHAQMAAFCDFYQPRSAFSRLKIVPFKKNSWLANLAIYRGLVYYYQKKRRPLPSFKDFKNNSLGIPLTK
ncbi:MAG: B12-binding domain-containing radical SAM protein [Sedimentisphaerales bacterium]|nr:B12-binding domain-containing radical SAM protein [Sedimentisphaerales bacterium]